MIEIINSDNKIALNIGQTVMIETEQRKYFGTVRKIVFQESAPEIYVAFHPDMAWVRYSEDDVILIDIEPVET